jgi:hypothetical protein
VRVPSAFAGGAVRRRGFGATPVSRRAALAAASAIAVSACAGPDSNDPPARRTATTTTGSPPATTPPAVELPVTAAYRILAGEVERSCKEAAVRWLEAALTWTPAAGGSAGAADRVARIGQPGTALAGLRPLLTDDVASTVAITYPQYGGLSDDRTTASVMVTVEQTVRPRPGERPGSRGTTLDVRLSKAGRSWRVSRVLAPPGPRPAGATGEIADRVLASDRLLLPAAARADVRAGLVEDRLLTLLTRLSARWTVGVQVLRSGHPRNVFGTSRASNHTLGRAVDIWSLDGVPVVDQRAADWRGLMSAAADFGVDEIGGPEDLDGRARRRPYFTNDVHQDHVHLGFDA